MAAFTKSTFTRKGVSTSSPSGPGPTSSNSPNTQQDAQGVYRSIYHGQPLVSSGLSEVDEIFGGGLPLGSLLLVEEDENSSFASTLLKYFLAQGAVSGQGLYLASAESNPSKLFEDLPNIATEAPPSSSSSTAAPSLPSESSFPAAFADANLKIAWQYEKYLGDQKSDLGRTGVKKPSNASSFDLTKTLKVDNVPLFDSCEKDIFNVSAVDVSGASKVTPAPISEMEYRLRRAYAHLNKIVNKYNSDFVAKKQGKVLRICIQSLLSPMWGQSHSPESQRVALQFVQAVKGLVRSSQSVAIISFPRFAFANNSLKYHFIGYANYLRNSSIGGGLGIGHNSAEETPQDERNRFALQIEHLFDAVVEFESFKDLSELPPDFHEFHGFFHIRKVPSLNALTFPSLERGTSFTFRLKRKKLHIEPIHLQPEISRASTGGKSEKELNEELKKNVSSSSGDSKPVRPPIDKHHIDF